MGQGIADRRTWYRGGFLRCVFSRFPTSSFGNAVPGLSSTPPPGPVARRAAFRRLPRDRNPRDGAPGSHGGTRNSRAVGAEGRDPAVRIIVSACRSQP